MTRGLLTQRLFNALDPQIVKIQNKAERDAERAAKMREKEERELVLKMATKAEADRAVVGEVL